MDVLSDILDKLRITGSVYFCDLLAPPWELPFENQEQALFHLVRRGRCRFEAAEAVHSVEAGDLVFVAPGVDHRLVAHDPSHPASLLLCGYCRFDSLEGDAFSRALPTHVLMKKEELQQWPWLQRTVEHLSAEHLSGAPGSELTVNKLTEVLLVQLLQADFGRRGRIGIVAALRDKRIAKALSAIHKAPAEQWTLQLAARHASMSRSGFARLFKELLGASFFDYLTRLRMRDARELLMTTNLPVPLIGENVGYRSELSFVKAFKKLNDVTPRGYRLR